MLVDWKLTIPLQKSERQDGWYITGVASGPGVDAEGDEFTPEALTKMAAQINESPVPFKDWHATNTIMSEMGEVTKAWLDSGYLGVEVKLDQIHPGAIYLWNKLDQGKQYGMSVEGGLNQYRPDPVRKSKNGKPVRLIDDVFLREVSATTKPIWTPSFGSVLKKAIDEAEAESTPQGDTTSMDVTPQDGVVQPTDVQTQAVEVPVAPTDETPAETTEVEKAVHADTAREQKMIERLVKHLRESDEILQALGVKEIVTAPADSTPETDTSKSAVEAKTDVDVDAVVRKAVEETTAAFRAEIEQLKERIPEVSGPGVLVRKSEQEEAEEAFAEIRATNPMAALKMALAAKRGEEYRG